MPESINAASPEHVRNPRACVEFCLRELGDHLVVAAPLGLGKPNHLVNAFYLYASENPDIRLDIFTALSLNPPKPGKGLQRRFLEPFITRHFGEYPRLAYLEDLDHDSVPANINVGEFYLRSGSRLNNSHAQRHYVSSNYTHVARDMQARGVNVLLQMVAVHPDRPDFFSLSSNPDVSMELVERLAGTPHLLIAQPNPDLPYMDGDAEVPRSFFDMVLEDHPQPLFAVPRMAVSNQDYLVGLYASALIRDQGTLQLGIGSLGDAVAFFTGMRHRDNPLYLRILEAAFVPGRMPPGMVETWGGTAPFLDGLYAASEMFMDGFLHLYADGVLSRKVYDHTGLQTLLNSHDLQQQLRPDTLDVLWQHGLLPVVLDREKLEWLQRFGILEAGISIDGEVICCPGGQRIINALDAPENRRLLAVAALGTQLRDGALLHAAFFLGSRWMYDTLNAMPDSERNQFRMTRVSRINQLYRNESMDRVQRLNSRCINTTMKVTLLGAAVSDQLENGQVVSGVGGQYNFVAMAHALDDSRSLLMLRSYREHHGKTVSNIVWEYPHATIPRHLRDIVITEYGVADLRGTSDEETIQRLLCISDSRWQEPLRKQAVHHHKLDPRWRIPDSFCNNTPDRTNTSLATFRQEGVLCDYPTGSDFTPEEIKLAKALVFLRSQSHQRWKKLSLLVRAFGRAGHYNPEFDDCVRRMNLVNPGSLRDRLDRRLLYAALRSTAVLDLDSADPAPNQ